MQSMAKLALQFNLQVNFLKEKERFVAFTPALDLSTSGKTLEEARKHFAEASILFFEELINKGTLEEVLSELGWEKVKQRWEPPLIISQQSETIRIPVNV